MPPLGMTLRRFDWALKTKGADLDRWPEPGAARALLQHSARARVLFADALATEAEPECSGTRVIRNLRQRLAAQTPLQAGLRWSLLVACAASGLLLGHWIAAGATPDALTMVQAALIP